MKLIILPFTKFKKQLLLVLIAICGVNMNAQSYIGFLTENYSGVNGVIRNPAYIADSRFNFDINLAGASGIFANDLFTTDNLFDILSDSDFGYPDDLDRDYSIINFAQANTDFLGPSVLFNINNKNTLALYTRARVITNIVGNGLNAETLLEDPNIEVNDFQVSSFNDVASLHGWGEIGLSYATILKDSGKHFLKGGVTLKYLVGYGRGYISTNRLGVDFTANGDNFIENFADGNVDVRGSLDYGSSIIDTETFDDFKLSNLELPKSFGADLGLVYEWRPDFENYYVNNDKGEQILDPTKNKYKLRVGVSVTDLGQINYKDGEEGIATINTTTIDLINDLNEVNDLTGVQNVLNNPVYADLIAQAASTPAFNDLINQVENASSVAEVESILDANADEINNILDGVENLTDARTLLDSYNIINFDAETGIKASLPTALHIDADWAFNKNFFLNAGTDFSFISRRNIKGNSIANTFSLTPRYESRLLSVYSPIRVVEWQGTLWGLGLRVGPLYVGSGSLFTTLFSDEIKGADVYAGLKVPLLRKINEDKDGDGLKDKKDACPEEAGPIENNGCPWPDTDGDSVTDNEDLCIDTPGEVKNNGCPWPDVDNDSIIDKKDDCPEVAGPAENNGCPWPDADGDGVFDKDDQCPETKGMVGNNGCPEVTETVQKELNSFAKTILFDPDKFDIKKESEAVMKEIVKILNEYPNAHFVIEGHTDSRGSYEKNQALSEKRAMAVMMFLVENGIDKSRLKSIGYGETKPIATNMYIPGRKQNRRVEINLVKK